MNTDSDNILTKSIEDLPFTDGLKSTLKQSGIENLRQLLNMNIGHWHTKIHGFTYHHQFEVLDYLDNNNLLAYIKEY